MPASKPNKFILAVSARALFDLSLEHAVFLGRGERAYQLFQDEMLKQGEALRPGVAMGLVRKFAALNVPGEDAVVEVVVVSRSDGHQSGMRVMNGAAEAELPIIRYVFTRGRAPVEYLKALKADLFLTLEPEDTRQALAAGIPAATLLPGDSEPGEGAGLRIALDGDCVCFGSEAEAWFRAHERDIEAFNLQEWAEARTPLSAGPFKPLLLSLQKLRERLRRDGVSPVRLGLFTARSAPAHARPLLTLQAWGVEVDEVAFLGGLEKSEHLKAFGADLFVDDQMVHCGPASRYVLTGHAPSEAAS